MGLVLPNLKAPHSGWPFEAHPRGSFARLAGPTSRSACRASPTPLPSARASRGRSEWRPPTRPPLAGCPTGRATSGRGGAIAARSTRQATKHPAPGPRPGPSLPRRGGTRRGRSHSVDRDSVTVAVHLTIGGVVSRSDFTHQVVLSTDAATTTVVHPARGPPSSRPFHQWTAPTTTSPATPAATNAFVLPTMCPL